MAGKAMMGRPPDGGEKKSADADRYGYVVGWEAL